MPTIYVKDKDNLPKRREHDFYPTPLEVCREALVQILNREIFERVLDPGAGNGVWGEAYREIFDDPIYTGTFYSEITGIELRDVEPALGYTYWITDDYLSNEWHRPDTKFDLIMGNPPYSLAKEFILKSLDLLEDSGYLLFLLRLTVLESQDRYENLYSKGLNPKEVWISTRRISFSGNKKSSPDAYCLCLWQKGWRGETTLKWLDWNYEEN